MASAREWVRFDIGLLDDERFAEMPADQRGCWTTVYLLIAREGDSVKSLDRLRFLLRRQGVPDLTDDLEARGWFVEHSQGGITLRGYEDRQLRWHRPSDDPDKKRERNARRPTTRAGRRGANVEHRGAPPPDPPVRVQQDRRSDHDIAPPEGLKPLRETLLAAGLDPAIIKGKERTS